MARARRDVPVRRSAHLVCHWRLGAFVVQNYATGISGTASSLAQALLNECSDWRSPGELAVKFADLIPGELSAVRAIRALVDRLVALTFLQTADAPPNRSEIAMRTWDRWNPAAGFFHSSTKNVRFLPNATANLILKRQARGWPMPTAVKRLRGAPRIPLPTPNFSGEIPAVLLRRRTWRRFSRAAVKDADLSTVLALTAGVQQWIRTATGDVPLKTSPSGGARHPIECYVCVRNVTGVRPGLYHYAADAHALEKIRGGDLQDRLRVWMPHSGYFAKAAFLIVLTAVFERQLWRYPYARAYRAALAEAGHVCQTFCLTATWLGLAPFCLMGLADDEIERDLGIDGITESVLYVTGAGSKPRGVEWAPTTRGTLDVRSNPVFRKR